MGVTVHEGRRFDRVPNWDTRNANYLVTDKTWHAWVERRLLDHAKRITALEAGHVPPAPTPAPTPTPVPPIPPPPSPTPPGTVLWDCPQVLDQGQEGECVGFGFADFLASQPNEQLADDGVAEALYESAQRFDGSPPDEQSGASVLGGAKAAQSATRISSYFWARTINDVIAAIHQRSPVVLGVDWYEGMMTPDAANRIHLTGQVVGGHCLIARGYDKMTDLITLRNSWGSDWGHGGDAFIRAQDLDVLLQRKGEACVPVKV